MIRAVSDNIFHGSMLDGFHAGDAWYFFIELCDLCGRPVFLGKKCNEEYGLLTVHRDPECKSNAIAQIKFDYYDQIHKGYIMGLHEETEMFFPGKYYIKVRVYVDGYQYTIIESKEFIVK